MPVEQAPKASATARKKTSDFITKGIFWLLPAG
jgi:hypothetical protein